MSKVKEGEEESELNSSFPSKPPARFISATTMVQLFDSQTSYPSTSIVAYHNGLFQTLSASSPLSVRLDRAHL